MNNDKVIIQKHNRKTLNKTTPQIPHLVSAAQRIYAPWITNVKKIYNLQSHDIICKG